MIEQFERYPAAPTGLAWRSILAAALVVAVGFLAATSFAQQAPPPETPGAVAEADPAATPVTEAAAGQLEQAQAQSEARLEMGEGVPTIAQLFMTSPYINSTLLALSVIVVLLFIYLIATVTTASFSPPRFIDDVTRLVLGKQFDQAIHLCQNRSEVFVASPVQRVVENRDKPHGVIIDILHAEGRRRGELVWNRIGYLSEIANIAPMIGLLGTLVGMIKVFFTLTTRTTGETAAGLSEGIAEAMTTTMFGLMVAIMAGVFYTLIRSRAVRVLSETEQICHTLADHTVRSAADGTGEAADAGRRKASRSADGEPDEADDGAVPAAAAAQAGGGA